MRDKKKSLHANGGLFVFSSCLVFKFSLKPFLEPQIA